VAFAQCWILARSAYLEVGTPFSSINLRALFGCQQCMLTKRWIPPIEARLQIRLPRGDINFLALLGD